MALILALCTVSAIGQTPPGAGHPTSWTFDTYTPGPCSPTGAGHGGCNPGGIGDFVRRYEFPTEDRLVLVPQERTDLRAVRLTWERLK